MPLSDPTLVHQAALINGAWIEPLFDKIEVKNPATGALLGVVPRLSAELVEHAIISAYKAFPSWSQTLAKTRSDVLMAWADEIRRQMDDLAMLLTSEQGKPIAEAKAELTLCVNYLDWFAGEARRTYGEIVPPHAPHRQILVTKQPVGVCAAITPWNFPASMLIRKVAPALAAGCTVVAKPASATPLIALALAALALRAGVPAGVLNIVTGSALVVGEVLASHPLIRKLSFTGSTAVGKTLMAQAASTLKRLSLELGGNAPFIVFNDADLDAAVDGALASKFRNSGQTCVCANRFLVQNEVYEAFADKLTRAVAKLKVGDGLDAGTEQGPLISAEALETVESLVQEACAKGAVALTGGERHQLGRSYYTPTVLSRVTPEMRVAQEEIFGPVAPLLRFTTENEAVALANGTPYGLASYVYTNDLGRAWRVARTLEFGMVSLNDGMLTTEVAPFGGIKESGFGREGGSVGIDEYLDVKYIQMAGL